jgi:fermentation-respiration switch protein FrsA (DUF1100 family)
MLRRALSVCALGLLLAACDDGGSAGDDSVGDDAPTTPDAAEPPGSPDAAVEDTPDAALPGTPDATPGSPDAAPPNNPDAGPLPSDVAGCGTSTFFKVPDDPAAPGPWAVGARTATIGRTTVEIWYPAKPGSEAGKSKTSYDIRLALPPSQQPKIPDAANPVQFCNCYRDLPIDDTHGPYPVVYFIHGTAGFRTQSLTQMTHWASRGFVVVAADHPGLWLADLLKQASFGCSNPPGTPMDPPALPQNLAGDEDAIINAMQNPTGALAFLAGRIDTARAAVVGHSAGANAVSGLANRAGVRVVIPLAGSSKVNDSMTLEQVLIMGGQSDTVVQYSSTKTSYNQSPDPKRLVGIKNAGHLAFADLCEIKNGSGKNMLDIATQYNVCGANLAGFLFDCKPTYTPQAKSWEIVNFATTAVLEGVNKCSAAQNAFSTLQSRFAEVGEYQHTP